LSQEKSGPRQLEIDADCFSSMLERGALEACLDELRRADAAGDPRPAANCRLAGALFHQDRREEAVECVRRGFPYAQDDAALLQLCAWVFSKNSVRASSLKCEKSIDLQ
jgi:hypothetical protein